MEIPDCAILIPEAKTTRGLRSNKFAFLGVGLVFATFLFTFIFLKTCFAIMPIYTKSNQLVDKPFVIQLNETIADISLPDVKISPAIDGKWMFKRGALISYDELIFTPNNRFKASTLYTVTLPKVERVVFGSTQIEKLQFQTEMAPMLADIGISDARDNSVIAADYVFKVNLMAPNKNLRELELRTNPNIEMIKTVVDDQYFAWIPTKTLPQGVDINVQVYDALNDIVLTTKKLRVSKEPSVLKLVTKYGFGKNDGVSIIFNEAIEPGASEYIVFDVEGKGKWKDDVTYIFTPKKVYLGKIYNYTIKAGLRSKSGGIVTTDQLATSSIVNMVAAKDITVQLSIPYYKQQYASSCTAASLRMALAYRGIVTDDMKIVEKMGYNPTIKNNSTDIPTWDDPQNMFVGSINGYNENTSAGPDAPPVAKAAESFGVKATAITNADVKWIAQQLYDGNPVIVFGAVSEGLVSWKTPSGRTTIMNPTGHAFLVTGVKGDANNPVGFWISDPYAGLSYWPASRVTENIRLDAYHQAVAIFGP